MIASATDRERMSQALALAALAEGTTGPNPRVGCVVLQGDRVVGSGFHQAAGQAHAEALALAEALGRKRPPYEINPKTGDPYVVDRQETRVEVRGVDDGILDRPVIVPLFGKAGEAAP